MKNRTLFPIPNMIASDVPMNTSPFYAWLQEQPTRQGRFAEALTEYLHPYGYRQSQHTLDGDELDSLRAIFGQYNVLWTPVRSPVPLSDMLTPSTSTDSFHLSGKATRYEPTDELQALIRGLGLLYHFSPANYYFQIINNTLYVKYQQILGSRALAPLTEV